ncbi:type II toxin-antitoxin system PemK/MazF family toxin [Rhodopseudomonas palustris]|uniref:type II toxin-antitoxin system PemK/MazF family toxin n=1 Tax=Rhodopseudomonas palustris TaxID=1076 RepID=UPI002ACD8333|nr:type II toxin-antitoxin system PemK/MazF family toxin [Rhodopseudomonas palustris]WQH00120.1 type II toxin-antitoxin system PemK/MazF family toxin [Rhodopseudomonas palustris]
MMNSADRADFIMAIREHPIPGTILVCNFDGTFREPEMVKPRCVVVLSPKIAARPGLCTVVCLSTTTPHPVMPYHCQIDIRPRLPGTWRSDGVWVKGDMIYAMGFHRLDLIRTGKTREGKRTYRFDVLAPDQMKMIKSCVLKGLGMSPLTKHL